MIKWIFRDWFYKIILASVWLFLLQPSGALAVVTDTHIECYTSGDFGGDTYAYDTYKVPVSVRVIGIDTILALHQAVCNAVKTVNEEGSTWSDPLIRIVYMVAGQQHRRNLRPNQCMFIVGLRFCARMTIPVEGKNVYGNTTGLEGRGMKPQLCAYVDPMDGGDTSANEGPYHHHTDISTFYDNLPVWAKVIAGPIGGIVGAITSVKNHVVVQTLACVDRPMAVGPPAWTNDAWKAKYFPPPTINYAHDSTFASPTIRLDFCKQNIVGVPSPSEERVLCQFEKDLALGEYKRDATGNLILLPGIRYEGTVNLTPTGAFDADVATASGTSPDGRQFEARISVEVPDSVCVYKTQEDGRNVDIIEGCLPRPGYMPVPSVTDISPGIVPIPDVALEGAGILGIKLGVSFPGLPGQIELEYLGDQYVGAGPPPAPPAVPPPPPPPPPAGSAVGDPINSCKTLHQVTFCAKPGPVDITDNGDGTFTAKGSLCIEGYDTAPLVAAGPYYKVETLTFGHDGKVIYDPPLPNPKALPVFKYAQASDEIMSADIAPKDGIPDAFPLPVNTFVPALTPFTNVTANRELVGGVPVDPTVTLKKGSYHYEPPMSNQPPLDPAYSALTPPQQRPINQSDPYFVGGPIDYDYNGDGKKDGYDNAQILRPMTPLDLGLCAEVKFDIVYTEPPPPSFPPVTPQEFPSPAGLAGVNWTTDTHINEEFISATKDCSKLKVKVWGAGGGGSSNVGQANDFSGGSGGFIEVEYDLLALNLVNAPIPVSVGIGGAFEYVDADVQNGFDGNASSFGIPSARVVAPGGGGFSKIVAAAGTCASPACVVARADPGLPGVATENHPLPNYCLGSKGLARGADAPNGAGGYTVAVEGTWQCEGSNDDSRMELFKDYSKHTNPGSALDGQYHHRNNLKYGLLDPIRTPGAGGCSSDRGCRVSLALINPSTRSGNVAPGALGKIEAVCTNIKQIIPPTPIPTVPATFP